MRERRGERMGRDVENGVSQTRRACRLVVGCRVVCSCCSCSLGDWPSPSSSQTCLDWTQLHAHGRHPTRPAAAGEALACALARDRRQTHRHTDRQEYTSSTQLPSLVVFRHGEVSVRVREAVRAERCLPAAHLAHVPDRWRRVHKVSCSSHTARKLAFECCVFYIRRSSP